MNLKVQQGLFIPGRVILLAICLLAPQSWAQPGIPADSGPPPSFTHPFEIDRQALDQALLALARQAQRPILFSSLLTDNKSSPGSPPTGDLEQALDYVLTGSGLVFRFTADGAIVIDKAPPDSPHRIVTPPIPEEVLVTGSLLRREDNHGGARPLTTLTRPTLRLEGTITLPAALQQLPMTAGAELQVNNLNQPLTAGTAAVNLRNLGLGTTLVLLDGQRQVDAPVATTEGETFVDVNALLPDIAIQRVEILRDGASSTYGTDAVGGVINVIPRHDFQGSEVSLRHASTHHSNQHSNQASLLLGGELGTSTQAMLALSLQRQSALLTTDRDFPDHSVVSNLGQPGTYLTSSGLVRDPACASSGGAITAGNPYCLFDSSPYFDLSPEETRLKAYAQLNYAASDSTDLIATLSHNRAEIWVHASPSFPFANTLPTVPDHNPGNDFGEDVQFYGRVLGADAEASRSRSEYHSSFLRLAARRREQKLSLDAGFNISNSEVSYGRRDTVRDRLQAALDGAGGTSESQYWNPRYGADNDPELVTGLFDDWNMRGRTRLASLDLSARLLDYTFVGRPAALAFGGQFRREWLSHNFSETYNDRQFLTLGGGPDFSANRDVSSLYAELLVEPTADLELQLTSRYEHAGSTRGDLSPKVDLSWAFSPDSLLHLSWSRPFRAPSLFQSSAQQSVPTVITDAVLPGNPLFANVITQGNNNLNAAKAHVISVGLSQQLSEGLSIELDAWYYDYQDVILKESAQAIVERAEAGDPTARAKVTRDLLTGQIAEITADFINAADIRSAGLDAMVDMTRPLRGGWLSSGLSFTWNQRFDIFNRATDSWTNGVGSLNATTPAARAQPRLKGYAYLQWQSASFEWRARLNGISGYQNDRTGEHIAGQATLDLHGRWSGLLPGGASLGLGVYNLSDRAPPQVDTFLGYDAHTHDPRGRVWYLGLDWRW